MVLTNLESRSNLFFYILAHYYMYFICEQITKQTVETTIIQNSFNKYLLNLEFVTQNDKATRQSISYIISWRRQVVYGHENRKIIFYSAE